MIDQTIEEIEEMQTHSSSVVAVKAADALRSLLDDDFPTVEEYVRALERNSSALRRAKPSHASLYKTQRQIVDTVTDADPATVAEAQELTDTVITDVIDTVESAKQEAAETALTFLEDGMTLLTHDYSTTILRTLELAAQKDYELTVYITEARPRYLGRKTARRLAEIPEIDPHLIVDSACGYFLSECDRVLVGMDSVVDGNLYNRIGTYPITATASDVGVPVTAVGASAKMPEGGFQFENEFRSVSEVMREPAEGFVVENPNYDATPVELLDSIVTDDGIKRYGE
ncbi:translation initiation factor eIF-2B [Halapricum salinum]|uniref:Translation initiation factor eIF-2B n=1 Tax=Halapricum salinum TaxID=1457250 RepID=A0A4D6HF71_9EURY|nr:translation initiation factor eIF-2B [Halapricum salinum]QCC52669.1 translation initiation factor eIF-2B [Halapricum salinum]